MSRIRSLLSDVPEPVPYFFILIALVKKSQIKLVVDKMIQGILKGSGQDLFLKMNGYKLALGV
jgi:hypothetical protein